ncbi:MAG: electron transfer flavoprotein subunit beta/FixA family protein [Candidatus Omnitrophica bacterium]|nr:electron transfer flavoprotein subunit beta/FixA family protein [Candidatus Omnitrophota bacterium]
MVLLKMVPDVVEELEIADTGKALNPEASRMILSETSDHAIEQALLLKEKYGGQITVISLDAPEVDDALFTALAKGADRAVKLAVDQTSMGTTTAARVFASFFGPGPDAITPDTLVVTGSQAIDDLDGELAPSVAEILSLPFTGVVTSLTIEDGGKKLVAIKEFSGGLRGEYELNLPAVMGIQAAEKPPRYVPVAKVRNAMKTVKIEVREAVAPEGAEMVSIERMYKPETAGGAEMLEGTPEEVARRIAEIMAEKGLL